MRVPNTDLGGERLVPAEFEKLGNVNGSGCVEQEAGDLNNIAGVIFEQRAPNVSQFLGSRAPLSAGVEQHLDAFEGFGFFFSLSVVAPG
jgi:hypothetical protein